jgi:hypothetical protein
VLHAVVNLQLLLLLKPKVLLPFAEKRSAYYCIVETCTFALEASAKVLWKCMEPGAFRN